MEGRTKIRGRFLLAMAGFAVACFLYYFEGRMNAQNTTAYAMNYRYGLIPRGFVGTLIYLLDFCVDFPVYTYSHMIYISLFVTIVLFFLFFAFYHLLLLRCKEAYLPQMMVGIMFLSVFLFPEFLTWNNFGRMDEYLMLLTIVCVFLLVWGHAEWLILPLAAVACLVHVGFVFTNVAIILVVLFYKALSNEKKRPYYFFLCFASFGVVSVLFLYFEIFRQPLGTDAYNEIVALAKSISEDGKSISDSLLDSEILCQSVYEDEWVWRKRNLVEFPIFLVFFAPYLIGAGRFFIGLVRNAKNKMDRFKYFIVSAGMITILPSMLLKVDYGRWIFCIVFYYITVLLVLIALGDEYVAERVGAGMAKIKSKGKFYPLFLLYPLLFMPFRDVYITDITTAIMNFIMGW